MLHDVTFDLWDAQAGRSVRHVVQVDADGGDDAASQGALKAAELGSGFKIISIVPSGAPQVVEAVPEGDDAPPEEAPKRKTRG